MNPKIPIHNKAFKYTPSAETDLAKTFARIRKEQKVAEKMKEAAKKFNVVLLGEKK